MERIRIFDSHKESFVLMRRFRAIGVNFKLLGVTFDPQLLMHVGTRKIAIEAGWRLQAVLRPRRFFTTPELFRLYKSLVVSFIESGTPGYFHAAESVLDCIDRVQRRFLREMDMPEEAALINFRLAPLRARRGMAILGPRLPPQSESRPSFRSDQSDVSSNRTAARHR